MNSHIGTHLQPKFVYVFLFVMTHYTRGLPFMFRTPVFKGITIFLLRTRLQPLQVPSHWPKQSRALAQAITGKRKGNLRCCDLCWVGEGGPPCLTQEYPSTEQNWRYFSLEYLVGCGEREWAISVCHSAPEAVRAFSSGRKRCLC